MEEILRELKMIRSALDRLAEMAPAIERAAAVLERLEGKNEYGKSVLRTNRYREVDDA